MASGPDPQDRTGRILAAARAYAPLLRPDQFFSHTTAAAIWGAPVHLADERIHVSVFGDRSLPRAAGVFGHRSSPVLTTTRDITGLRVSSPASTWASLDALSVIELVQIGDHLCRVWRRGRGRPHAGRAPIATPEELRRALDAGRHLGASRLREALGLIRLDSWSPRESRTRVELEYQGEMHASSYAADIERIERLRAHGWEMIQATKATGSGDLARRVRIALLARGANA
ncbi:hypothetical protein [Microbacterium indicum]|uniref:hypothetical protein n=1 Tax=Microbacterium indicum TaxID=358100 RepID=UPI0003FFBCAE|nr:hypothetical protein [Microbacterium indicum]